MNPKQTRRTTKALKYKRLQVNFKNSSVYGIALITVAALLIRIWDLNWGLPELYEEATPMYRAFSFWGKDTGKFDLNPHFFNYPAFYFYIQFAAQGLYFLFGRLIGLFSSLDSFRTLFDRETVNFIILGRFITTLFGVSTVVLISFLGAKFFNRKIGAVAAFFLAFNFLHVTNSQFISVDVPLTFFIVLAFFFLYSVYEDGNLKGYVLTGLCIGLGTGTKYTAALLILPFLAAHFFSKSGPRSLLYRLVDKRMALGIMALVLTFFLVSPFCLLDFPSFWSDFSFEMRHMASGHFGHEEDNIPYLSYMTGYLKKGCGIPIELLALLGFTLMFVRRRKKELLFLSFPILYFAIVGRWSVQSDRYILPIVPFLLVAAAYSLHSALEKIPLRGIRQSIITGICALCLIIPPAAHIIQHKNFHRKPDTRALAKGWIERTVPQGSIIALESHTPALDEKRYLCIHIPMYTVTPELTAPFYNENWYRGANLLVLSSYVYGRYQRDQEKYFVQNQFYTQVDTLFTLAKTFDAKDGQGPVIKIYRNQNVAAENFSDFTDPLNILMQTPLLTFDRKVLFLTELGTAYLQRAETVKAAVPLLREASRLQPLNPELHCQLATAYFFNGQPDESLSECEKVLAMDPRFPKAHFIRALVLDETGRTEEAIDVYKFYLSLNQKDIVAHMRIALAYEKRDDIDKALKSWQDILRIDPRNTMALDNIERLQSDTP